MKCKFGKSYKLFYFQVRESPAPLNIPTPAPAPDREVERGWLIAIRKVIPSTLAVDEQRLSTLFPGIPKGSQTLKKDYTERLHGWWPLMVGRQGGGQRLLFYRSFLWKMCLNNRSKSSREIILLHFGLMKDQSYYWRDQNITFP